MSTIASPEAWLETGHILRLLNRMKDAYDATHPKRRLLVGDTGLLRAQRKTTWDITLEELGAVAFIWNPSNHWTATYGIVQHDEKRIDMYYCDSLNAAPNKTFVAFVQYFWNRFMQWSPGALDEGWKISHYTVPVPLGSVYNQLNGCDCGIYAYAFVRNNLLGREHRLYLPEHRNLTALRQRLQYEYDNDLITTNPTLNEFQMAIKHHFWGSEHMKDIAKVRKSCTLKMAKQNVHTKYVAVDVLAVTKKTTKPPCKKMIETYQTFLAKHLYRNTFKQVQEARQDNVYWQAFLSTPSAYAATCLLAIENNQPLPDPHIDMTTFAMYFFPRPNPWMQTTPWMGGNWTWEKLIAWIDNIRRSLRDVFKSVSLYNKWVFKDDKFKPKKENYRLFLESGKDAELKTATFTVVSLEQWKGYCATAFNNTEALHFHWGAGTSGKKINLNALHEWFWDKSFNPYPVIREASNDEKFNQTSLRSFLQTAIGANDLQTKVLERGWKKSDWHPLFYAHALPYRKTWNAWARTGEGLDTVKKHYTYLKRQLVDSGFWTVARHQLPDDVPDQALPFMVNLKNRLIGVLGQEHPTQEEPVFVEAWKDQKLVDYITQLQLYTIDEPQFDNYWRYRNIPDIQNLLRAEIASPDLETLYEKAKKYTRVDHYVYGVLGILEIKKPEFDPDDICQVVHTKIAWRATMLEQEYANHPKVPIVKPTTVT